MMLIFRYVGKVPADATYNTAITTICAAITGQTDQVMIRFKIFTAMPQEGQPFSTWWTIIKEQANKCVFKDYNWDRAARDALLFQTSDVKLQKKILAEDLALEDMVKMGLAHEQTQMKSDQMDGGSNGVSTLVRRFQEEVGRLSLPGAGNR